MSLFSYWPGYWDEEDWERSCKEDRDQQKIPKTYAQYTNSVEVSLDGHSVRWDGRDSK